MDNFRPMFITFETYTLVGNYVLAVQQRQLRALFCHYHIKCHSINIHKILDGNIYLLV